MAVWTPGLVPTKTQIKLGSSMSTSGDRWAYCAGPAYLLVLRFFFGGGDGPLLLSVAAITVALVRLVAGMGDAGAGV